MGDHHVFESCRHNILSSLYNRNKQIDNTFPQMGHAEHSIRDEENIYNYVGEACTEDSQILMNIG